MAQPKGCISWNSGKGGYKLVHHKMKNFKSLAIDAITKGHTSSEIMKILGVCETTFQKHIKRVHPRYRDQLRQNIINRMTQTRRTPESRLKSAKISTGRPSYAKGKTYLQIFGCEKRAKERAAKTSAFMKTERNIRRYMKKVSKGQQALFEIVKKKYPHAVMEHPITIDENPTIWLDIAVLPEQLNFEYDGTYWHSTKEQITRDKRRDGRLTRLGWTITRIRSSQDLTTVEI